MLNILKNKNIIMSMFLLLTISLVFLTHNFFNKKDVEKVLEENNTNRKQFSVYVEDDGKYVEYNDSKLFPNTSKYIFNLDKSYCMDIQDNLITDSINYANGKVSVTSNKTVYCYLYFDANNFDISTNLYLVNNGIKQNISKTPTTDENYDYIVSYNCLNNNAIEYFNYDYTTHEYIFSSLGKNKCDIYFDNKIPDITINLYVNDEEISELSSDISYTLNETLSVCTNNEAIIEYDDTTKKVVVTTSKQTECNIYLEGE